MKTIDKNNKSKPSRITERNNINRKDTNRNYTRRNDTKRNDTKRKDSKRKNSKRNRLNAMLATCFMIFLPLLLLYLLLSYYYKDHFYNNTEINGVVTSNMTVSEAEEAIDSQVASYRLILEDRSGALHTITGESINLHTVFEGCISDIFESQNVLTWPRSIFQQNEFNISTMLKYDEELLKNVFYELILFEIIPESIGNKIDEDILYEAVRKAISSLEPTLNIEETGCYEEPELTSNSLKLTKALEEMNRIAGAKITYEFGEDIEILDGNQISKWITVDDEFKVHLNKDSIKEYVDFIGKTYNSFGRERDFITSYGDKIKIKGGDYGWWLDRVKEVSELTELIQNGEQLIREPAYFQTAQQYGQDDIGDTYVEVNITAQHLFFYKEGELILETDFVSGNLSKEYGTPVGTYPIQYKENDATLVGEDYATPVKYWMPFNRNIGFHDASWRDEFGKDIYLTNGSHGCINMPPKAAEIMFQNIHRGVAVVVYELPGTEGYEIEESNMMEDLESNKKD
jgi:hypothetical protein